MGTPAARLGDPTVHGSVIAVSSETKDAQRVTQRQIYARSSEVVGILTLTGLDAANQDMV